MIWEEIGRDRASSVKCAHRYKHCCVMNPQIRALAKMQVPLMKSCCPSGIPFSSKDGWWNMRLMLEETGKDTVGSSLLLYWCLNWSQPLKLDRVASEYSVLTKIRVWLHKQWNQKCSHCPSSNERRKKWHPSHLFTVRKYFVLYKLRFVLMWKHATHSSKSLTKMLTLMLTSAFISYNSVPTKENWATCLGDSKDQSRWDSFLHSHPLCNK